jgi:hypothetical protein
VIPEKKAINNFSRNERGSEKKNFRLFLKYYRSENCSRTILRISAVKVKEKSIWKCNCEPSFYVFVTFNDHTSAMRLRGINRSIAVLWR